LKPFRLESPQWELEPNEATQAHRDVFAKKSRGTLLQKFFSARADQ